MKAHPLIPLFSRGLLGVATAVLSLASLSLNGAGFIKFDGIPGESTDSGHKQWIDIQSMEWGMEQEVSTDTSGGGGAGKVNFDKLLVTKSLDKSTPLLMQACATGKPIPTMTLELVRSGSDQREPYLVITMTDVVVASVRTSTSAADGVPPLETITLNYSKVVFSYTPQNPDGTMGEPVIFRWNLLENTE